MSRALARRPVRRNPDIAGAFAKLRSGGARARATVERIPGVRRVPRWGWYALGAVSVGGLAWWFFGGRTYSVQILRQANKLWSTTPLGKSTEFTIGEAGCMLTSLTMAVNTLTHDEITPDVAQAAALNYSPNTFSGPELVLEKAADALGVRAPESERIHDTDSSGRKPTAAQLSANISAALRNKGMAIVHVAKDFSATGEHFLLVYKKKGGMFVAADPAPGADVLIDPKTLTGKSDWGYKVFDYRIVGSAPVYAA